MKIPAMRATLGLIVLAACGVARARAQATPDTGVVVRGFLQHDPNGGWTIVVPESFEAAGGRQLVLPLPGQTAARGPPPGPPRPARRAAPPGHRGRAGL